MKHFVSFALLIEVFDLEFSCLITATKKYSAKTDLKKKYTKCSRKKTSKLDFFLMLNSRKTQQGSIALFEIIRVE